MNLKDQVVLITGAGNGIGRKMARVCAGYGATVVALDIDGEAAQDTQRLIAGDGGNAKAVQADITSRQQVKEAVQYAVDSCGKLDVLINNAGSTRLGVMAQLDDSAYDFIVNLNMKGPYIVSTEASRVMMARNRGRIINITSYCAVRGEYANGPYCMAKAAVGMMTQVQALELGRYGISTVAIAPGDINTELLQDAFQKRAQMEGSSIEEIYANAGKKAPLGRVGEPEDIAELAAFLCDQRSHFINGSQILATGGYVMT